MSETDAWMPLYVADYIRDTQQLSTAEHGAYILLILCAWGQDGKLPKDTERLRRITKMTPRQWKESWPILREYFEEDDTGFRHRRVERERAKAADIVEKRREAGRAGAAKRWHGDGIANAMANASQIDGPSQSHPQSQLEEEEKHPLPHGALAFSGRVVRLNQRDFEQWARSYHGIPDLRAELTALDDWLRDCDDPRTVKRWFQVVSGSLAKKHQAALAERTQSHRGIGI